MRSNTWKWLLATALLAVIVVAGCGDREEEKAGVALLERREEILEEEKEEVGSVIEELERESLERRLSAAEDSLADVDRHIAGLGEKKKRFVEQEQYVSDFEERLKKMVSSEVSDIDLSIQDLERESAIAQKKIRLNLKKISVAEKKIQAYQEELELCDTLKYNLLQKNAPEDEIEATGARIDDIGEIITEERVKLADAIQGNRELEVRIREIDEQILRFRQLLQAEYERKDALEDFMAAETERLEREKTKNNADRAQLQEEKRKLHSERTILEKEIAELGGEIRQLKGSLSEAAGKMASLETEEAGISREEADLFFQKSRGDEEAVSTLLTRKTLDTGGSEAAKLARLAQEVAEEKAKISGEQARIAREKYHIQTQRAEMARKNVEKMRIWLILLMAVICVIVILLTSFYLIGKWKKGKHNAASMDDETVSKKSDP